MDKKKQILSIKKHEDKIIKIKEQIEKVKQNHLQNKNTYLPDNINEKIFNLELGELNLELNIHLFCISCLKKREYLPLITDSDLTNARKKKIIKLAKSLEKDLG